MAEDVAGDDELHDLNRGHEFRHPSRRRVLHRSNTEVTANRRRVHVTTSSRRTSTWRCERWDWGQATNGTRPASPSRWSGRRGRSSRGDTSAWRSPAACATPGRPNRAVRGLSTLQTTSPNIRLMSQCSTTRWSSMTLQHNAKGLCWAWTHAYSIHMFTYRRTNFLSKILEANSLNKISCTYPSLGSRILPTKPRLPTAQINSGRSRIVAIKLKKENAKFHIVKALSNSNALRFFITFWPK